MTSLVLRDLSCAIVRSNPQYQFVHFERLSEADLACIGVDAKTSTFIGVLIDIGSGGLSMKAISADTAALFEQLRTPRRVQAVLRELPLTERDRILTTLVLDGILAIAIDGAFVTQCAACPMIVQNTEDVTGTNRLARLSIAALQHGQRLGIREPKTLAARLYFYHRIPVTSCQRKLWPDADAVLQFLALAPGGDLRHGLFSRFKMFSPSGDVPWLSWRRRVSKCNASSEASRWKLYVSPAVQHTKQAFTQVVALLSSSNASSLKIGPNAHGLLRPDKLVVYFDRRDDLFRFAEALLPRMDNLSAHGVPFSAPIDDAGLLSWGIDPRRHKGDAGWYADDSWRIWLCNRLAVALISAVNGPETEISPWRYALIKLWLMGVDTRTWTLHEA